jgi:DNA-binding NarL/FixJ family response regulator
MDFSITGIVKDETGAIIKSENLKPDILILDLQLSGLHEPGLVRTIRRRSPSTAIIVLCDNCESTADMFDVQDDLSYCPVEIHASLDVTAGISGFLLKEMDIDKLAYIVKIVSLGGCYINSSITVKVFSSVIKFSHQNKKPGNAVLSPAERNIIALLAQGFSDVNIADELNLHIGTIRNYVTKIKNKINTKSRIEIVLYSLLSGVISLDDLRKWKMNDSVFEIQKLEK